MEAKTIPDYPRSITFEQVWAALQETDRIIKENAKKMREDHEKTAKEMKKYRRETNKQFGKLGNRFGEMVEYMVVPNLITKFKKLGFVFKKAYRNATIEDRENNIFTEVDITLENGDKVMLVEVKSKPTTEDITEHVERIAKVKTHSEIHGEKRKFLGAVAGMVFNDNEKTFALKNGFYVIEPSGETFNITPPDGQPREW
jgi:hypothetical protein